MGINLFATSTFVLYFIRLPPPGECDLYYVNRDTLFSYHKESELFLQVLLYIITELLKWTLDCSQLNSIFLNQIL